MFFWYVDESGKAHPKHQSKFLTIATIGINHDDWGIAHDLSLELKRKYFGIEVEHEDVEFKRDGTTR